MRILLTICFSAFAAVQTTGEGSAPAVARLIRETGLDAAECYRIRDFSIVREDAKFYINDGFVIFGKPIKGSRMSLMFSGDVEGGDAEVLISPPHRGERRTLAKFTESPTLNEHFRTALFLFTDGSVEQILNEVRGKGAKSPEMGLLLESQHSPTVRNLQQSFELRTLLDLDNPARGEQGIFFATVGTQRLGVFDVVHDPMAREQIMVGQYVNRDKGSVFDIWTSFESQSVRTGRKKVPEPIYSIDRFKIAEEKPFCLVFWPDPSRSSLKLPNGNTTGSYNASFASTDPRKAYNHMAGRTAFMFVVPLFPSS